MFLIKNKFDLNSDGMFSKTGKITNQKFYILSKKKEILNPNKNYFKVPTFSTSEKVKEILKDLIINEDEEDNIEEEFLWNIDQKNDEKIINIPQKKEKIFKKKKDKTKEPFFKIVSRNKLNYLESKNKELVPPLGLYNPKSINKEKIFTNYNKEKVPKFRAKNDKKENITKSDLNFKPKKPIKKVYGYYNFSKTVNRDGFSFKNSNKKNNKKKFDENLTYDNFNYNNIPKNSMKSYRTPNFFLNKMTGREKYEIKKLELPIYNPNYNFIKKRAGSAVPNFDSYIPRDNLYNKKNYINETIFDYEKAVKNKHNNLYKYKQIPNFKKDLSRRPLTKF